MTKKTGGEWCARCHHCITWSGAGRGWVHVSDDDWSGACCTCVTAVLPCLPPAKKRHL